MAPKTDCRRKILITSAFALYASRLVKLTPGVNFINVLKCSFLRVKIPKAQKDSQVITVKKKSVNFFFDFGHVKAVDEIDPREGLFFLSLFFVGL